MKITVIGTGYVGLVQGACLSEIGHEVFCVDNNPEKIHTINSGEIPIYEPGLREVVKTNQANERLQATTDLAEAMKDADMIFIAVGTPPAEDGMADLKFVKAVAKEIGQHLDHYAIIVNKSTVPVGTGDMVRDIIQEHYDGDFQVCSNPEFLKEGSALSDFMEPDRIIIGIDGDTDYAQEQFQTLYSPLQAPLLFTDVKTAELTKYAANSFLAMQISFINSLSDLAEKTGANIRDVATGMKMDTRIGPRAFLNAGIGYGGSCFPKDVDALIAMAENYQARDTLLKDVREINYNQRLQAVAKIEELAGGSVLHKTIAVWGLAFKPNTDDIRESAAIDIIQILENRGATVQAYDPIATETAAQVIGEEMIYDDKYQALDQADVLVVATDWEEFQDVDWSYVKERMQEPALLDGRNMYERRDLEHQGFTYEGIGV